MGSPMILWGSSSRAGAKDCKENKPEDELAPGGLVAGIPAKAWA